MGFKDSLFFYQNCLSVAVGTNRDGQTDTSNSLLFLGLYSSTSSIANLFTSIQSIQIANCSTQNPCLHCYQDCLGPWVLNAVESLYSSIYISFYQFLLLLSG